MKRQENCDSELCNKLKKLGFEETKRIRIYGEEFDLTSNPVESEIGYEVEVINIKSGTARSLPIPKSIVQMVTSDVAAGDRRRAA